MINQSSETLTTLLLESSAIKAGPAATKRTLKQPGNSIHAEDDEKTERRVVLQALTKQFCGTASAIHVAAPAYARTKQNKQRRAGKRCRLLSSHAGRATSAAERAHGEGGGHTPNSIIRSVLYGK